METVTALNLATYAESAAFASQLNRAIARAMTACKKDSTGAARAALASLNHARRLYKSGLYLPAYQAAAIAKARFHARRVVTHRVRSFGLAAVAAELGVNL